MHYVKFTVRKTHVLGGRFPIDMLRYDRCFPANQEDVSWLTTSLFDNESVELMLATYSHRAFKGWKLGDPKPKIGECPITIERWQSFG